MKKEKAERWQATSMAEICRARLTSSSWIAHHSFSRLSAFLSVSSFFCISWEFQSHRLPLETRAKRIREELPLRASERERERERERKRERERERERKRELKRTGYNLAKGCKTSEKEHQESVKCTNHEAVIGGNYDNSIPRAKAVLRAGVRVQQHACERSVHVHTRIYGVSGDHLLSFSDDTRGTSQISILL